MRRFADLFTQLDQASQDEARVAALARYLAAAPEADRMWAIALLSGQRPRRKVTTTALRDWALDRAGLPLWLFEECQPLVGDQAETIALLLPPAAPDPAPGTNPHDLADWIAAINALKPSDTDHCRTFTLEARDRLAPPERLVFNKLITGSFRLDPGAALITRALSRATGIDPAELAQRLAGPWTAGRDSYVEVILAPDPTLALANPYPLVSIPTHSTAPEDLGPAADWAVTWAWDGLRAQLVLRGGTLAIWAPGPELVTGSFPDLAMLADYLPPGTVLDGTILPWADAAPLPAAGLHKRLARKSQSRALLAEVPVIYKPDDLLETAGEDLRRRRFGDRRAALEALTAALPADAPLALSPLLAFDNWTAASVHRAAARARGAVGLLLMRRDGGDGTAAAWLWPADPLSVTAVLVYAQLGQGAARIAECTFAAWSDGGLVAFTRTPADLPAAEAAQLAEWIRKNTLERFGPVRRVPPEQVFEITFDGIAASPRHKSGLALRNPRLARWWPERPASSAQTLEDLQAMMSAPDERRPA